MMTSRRSTRRTDTVRLAAALIVRDEEANIGDCLQALTAVVDEVHVHDTGSTDATPELAAGLGARVTRGSWSDDFAAARNAALEGWTADWVLSVDADEVVIADRKALRRFLATTTADVLTVAIENRQHTGHSLLHQPRRLFRPAVAHWEGRLHEQVVGRAGTVKEAHVPARVLHIDHHGYVSDEVRREKGERNAHLARIALGELAAQGAAADRSVAARSMLDLGRSLASAHQLQDALDAFEAVRELCPDTPEWFEATDFLFKIVLNADMVDVALTLVLQLRAAGASSTYCDWLEAHCHAKLGDFATAQQLLAGVTEVIDPAAVADLKRRVDELART
jgi:hypothetical protein